MPHGGATTAAIMSGWPLVASQLPGAKPSQPGRVTAARASSKRPTLDLGRLPPGPFPYSSWLSGQREDFRSVFGDRDGVFEVGRQ